MNDSDLTVFKGNISMFLHQCSEFRCYTSQAPFGIPKRMEITRTEVEFTRIVDEFTCID